jgi:hypothetical protein
MNRTLLLAAAAVLAVAGCTSEDGETPATKTSLGTAPAGDLTVELLTDTALETGMTPIYVKVTTASGETVTDATVTFVPLMTMTGGMSHSAPVIGAPMALDADGFYRCDVVFSMASGAMGTWSATVDVTPSGSAMVTATFPSLTVTDSGRVKAFTAPDASRYVLSLNFAAAPTVGLNPVVVTLHRRQDAMTYVPVDDATIHLDPQMPSMGHGSTGTVDPTLTSRPGVYEGQLSFSMPGTWETTATVSRASAEITGYPAVTDRPKFTVTF